jgi:hypothetical protein
MPGKRHARHGRPRLWIEYSPWWLRHPSEAVKVLNRNADYFERKIKALVEVREYLDLAEAIKSRMLERASQAVSEDRRRAIDSTEAVNEIELLRQLQAKYPEVTR